MLNLKNISVTRLKDTFGKTAVTCPSCKQNVRLKDTPLLSIFVKKAEAGLYPKTFNTIDDLNGTIQTSIDYYAEAAQVEQCHQYKSWGCNKCVKAEKAIIADFSKQQPSFGGPYIMYLDKTFNCKYCETPFVFSAREQQYWYEELNLVIDAIATRCEECRKKKLVQQRLMKLLAKEPDFSADELAELVECYKIIGSNRKAEEFSNRLKKKRNANH
jgi:RNase P subunit RPR2